MTGNNFLCEYSIKQFRLVRHVCKHSFPEIYEVNLRTLTERHVITFRKQLINLLYQPAWVILVRLGEINMIPLIILNKTQSFITGYNVSFIINKYMIRPFITCCNRMGHLPTYSMWQPIELQYGTIYYLRQYIYWMNIHKSSWS